MVNRVRPTRKVVRPTRKGVRRGEGGVRTLLQGVASHYHMRAKCFPGRNSSSVVAVHCK
jgi:hypothetical protein